jgi:HTH-type transcriptional regulator / antitoxin HigA
MMNIKIIKTEKEYEEALARIEELFDIIPGDPKEDEFDLLCVLVKKYEDENYKIDLPDPIEAIKFRMEQSGISRKELAKYIGSVSKVSEILNRKRSLSLSMIKALHEGLGIPADILLKDPTQKTIDQRFDIRNYPFTEMYNRGYFGDCFKKLNDAKEYAEECLSKFFSIFDNLKLEVCYRKSTSSVEEKGALMAWHAQALNICSKENLPAFKKEKLENSLDRLIKLSYFPSGVQIVKEALNEIGIHFVILSHLPKTKLDGACFFSPKGNPVIAMTIRYDRLDNFWFTLFHEIGHIYFEDINSKKKIILDDTESLAQKDNEEMRADQFALDSLIHPQDWKRANKIKSKAEILNLAEKLSISPAIIAGRIRKERNDYSLFSDLLGQGRVRMYLENKLAKFDSIQNKNKGKIKIVASMG